MKLKFKLAKKDQTRKTCLNLEDTPGRFFVIIFTETTEKIPSFAGWVRNFKLAKHLKLICLSLTLGIRLCFYVDDVFFRSQN